jgi:hypothetical protein
VDFSFECLCGAVGGGHWPRAQATLMEEKICVEQQKDADYCDDDSEYCVDDDVSATVRLEWFMLPTQRKLNGAIRRWRRTAHEAT